MNEREATDYVAGLVDTIPDSPAPSVELLVAGERARRRRKARVASAVAAATVVVIALTTATASLVGREAESGPATNSSDTVPDPAGAVQVVMDWLITTQQKGPQDACRFMTPDFQAEMVAFNCNNPNVKTPPPFGIGDIRDARARVLSQDGDEAVVEVTLPGAWQIRSTYITRYDHDRDRWLVAGREPALSHATVPDAETQRTVSEFVHRIRRSHGSKVYLATDWETATILIGAETPIPSELQALDDTLVAGLRVDVFPAAVTVRELAAFMHAVDSANFPRKQRVYSFGLPQDSAYIEVNIRNLSNLTPAQVADLQAQLEHFTEVRIVLQEAQEGQPLTGPLTTSQ